MWVVGRLGSCVFVFMRMRVFIKTKNCTASTSSLQAGNVHWPFSHHPADPVTLSLSTDAAALSDPKTSLSKSHQGLKTLWPQPSKPTPCKLQDPISDPEIFMVFLQAQFRSVERNRNFYYIGKNNRCTIPFLWMQIELNKSVFGVIIQASL